MYLKKDQYEWDILHAFSAGMHDGYAIDHTNIDEEESRAIRKHAEKYGFKRTTIKLDQKKEKY